MLDAFYEDSTNGSFECIFIHAYKRGEVTVYTLVYMHVVALGCGHKSNIDITTLVILQCTWLMDVCVIGHIWGGHLGV